jgi:hypothetical protein
MVTTDSITIKAVKVKVQANRIILKAVIKVFMAITVVTFAYHITATIAFAYHITATIAFAFLTITTTVKIVTVMVMVSSLAAIFHQVLKTTQLFSYIEGTSIIAAIGLWHMSHKHTYVYTAAKWCPHSQLSRLSTLSFEIMINERNGI